MTLFVHTGRLVHIEGDVVSIASCVQGIANGTDTVSSFISDLNERLDDIRLVFERKLNDANKTRKAEEARGRHPGRNLKSDHGGLHQHPQGVDGEGVGACHLQQHGRRVHERVTVQHSQGKAEHRSHRLHDGWKYVWQALHNDCFEAREGIQRPNRLCVIVRIAWPVRDSAAGCPEGAEELMPFTPFNERKYHMKMLTLIKLPYFAKTTVFLSFKVEVAKPFE